MFYWKRQVRPGWGMAFTDIAAGTLSLSVPAESTALQGRAALRSALGLSQDFQFMSQVHGRIVEHLAAAVPPPTADGMISESLPLAVLVADCLPVLMLADAGRQTFSAAVHAGRAGVVQGVLPTAVEKLRQQGATAVEAWIGPAICGACYEVPAELRAEVADQFPAAYAETRWGTPALDLRAAATGQLKDAGVQVHQLAACTLEHSELYSHRASQQQGRPIGRFAGLVFRLPQESVR